MRSVEINFLANCPKNLSFSKLILDFTLNTCCVCDVILCVQPYFIGMCLLNKQLNSLCVRL